VADLGRSRVTGGLDLVCCLLAVVVMHCVDGHLRRDADGRRTGGAEPVPACMRPEDREAGRCCRWSGV
jgi:hypothetical protein